MQIQQIALDKLVPAKAPVRHTNGAKGKTNIEELAASIAAHGLLQNLVVAPSGKKFQVIAGNHRLAALELLAKKKGSGITATTKIPCRVVAEDGQGHAIAENVVRAPLHFIDEAEAFADLVHQGMEPAKVAGMFAWTEKKVRQMHALGMLPQPIRDSARAGEIGLDACKAYTLFGVDAPGKAGVANGKRAFECWKQLRRQADHNNSQMIRRVAREATVPIAHALFDPTQHQDQIATDLFGDHAAFRDVAKFWELQNQAIEAEAQRLKGIGWSDVRVIRDQKERNNIWRDYEQLPGQLDTATEKPIKTLEAEEQAIENKEEWSEEDNDRLDQIRAEQDKLRETNATYTDRQMKKRCALILVDERTGEVEIKLGMLNRKEAEKAQAAKARKKQGDIVDAAEDAADQEDGAGAIDQTNTVEAAKPDRSYPRNVLADLLTQKSLMLQYTLGGSFKAALAYAIWSICQRGKAIELHEDDCRYAIDDDKRTSPIAETMRGEEDLPMRLGLRNLVADSDRGGEDGEDHVETDSYTFTFYGQGSPTEFLRGLLGMELAALQAIFTAIVARSAGFEAGDPSKRPNHKHAAFDNDAMNLLAAELQVNPRSWWTPTQGFFESLPRKTLLDIAKAVFDKDFVGTWRGAKVGELAKAMAERWTWDGASEGERQRRDFWLPPALRVPLTGSAEPVDTEDAAREAGEIAEDEAHRNQEAAQ